MGDSEVATLETLWYTGKGSWNLCVYGGCGITDQDWGADSMIEALYLHWLSTKATASSVPPIMNAVAANASKYPTGNTFSDVPMWDSIADTHEFQVTGNADYLAAAEAAFDYVDRDPNRQGWAAGHCPGIHYRIASAGNALESGLKTLETDSNYIKAAILLYQSTGAGSYLTKAETMYANVRATYLEHDSPLYTVYIFDDGSSCLRVRNQFFASVNGNMIWNGHELGLITGNATYNYSADAAASARYLMARLDDPTGVFENERQENDTAEPLVFAMYQLAVDGDSAASNWIAANLAAAASAETSNGIFGRFWGGPPPIFAGANVQTSTWSAAGGTALAFAVAKLNPGGTPSTSSYWNNATYVADPRTISGTGTYSIRFTGRAVAVIGNLTAQRGKEEVYIDGVETTNNIGVSAYPAVQVAPNQVMFAWRWPTSGMHTIEFEPPVGNQQNVKQGNAWFSMVGYYWKP